MEAAASTLAVLDVARASGGVFCAIGDDAVVAELDAWEQIGRLVDARRIAVAAEVDRRSRAGLGEQGLAFTRGAKDGENLVADAARISITEARRRVAIGTELAPQLSLAGEVLPGRFPLIADAVASGAIGVEAAKALLEAVRRFRRKAPREAADVAERALVREAATTGPELLRIEIEAWVALLDPDGAKPDEEERHRRRSLRLGRPDEHGMTRMTVTLTPEDAAILKTALADHRRSTVQIKIGAGDGEDCDELGSHWRELDGAQRTLPQQDYDTLMGIVGAGLKAEAAGWDGTAVVPHEVVVHANAADLADGRGSAWTDGVLTRLAIPTVERLMCDGVVRFAVFDDTGEPLHLGRKSRLFSPAQRKALVARWRGCAFPACTAPALWTHAHHVEWWIADDGPTDIVNGVLLCSYHHHLIHVGTSPWRMVLHDRQPHLIPKSWRGPPEDRHRLRPRPTPLAPTRDG